MMEENLKKEIWNLCKNAGEEEAFAEAFYQRLLQDEEICGEFVYYAEHRDFACKVNVRGYTVIDVMIWQMDHFKAWLDRDTRGTRQNRDRMVLLAFDTLLKMKKEPDFYIDKMQNETGTDYEGKYQ